MPWLNLEQFAFGLLLALPFIKVKNDGLRILLCVLPSLVLAAIVSTGKLEYLPFFIHGFTLLGGLVAALLTLPWLQPRVTRWMNWRWLGLVAILMIFTFAITTLVGTLKGIDTNTIRTSLTGISHHNIGLSALCVFSAFCTLTTYDFFALRTIGAKHIPYRIAALSNFISYSIGRNIGAPVLAGGAVRLRIFSHYGLNAIDAVKVGFLSSLGFWLANAFVLLVGVAFHPAVISVMTQLPAATNRMIAVAGLLAIFAYLAWLATGGKRRKLGQQEWMALPSASLTLVQILIGGVHLGFCALAIYLLMPATPSIDFISLLVMFILATLLSVLSLLPAAVFDSTMLISFREFDPEQLIATVLVFRILYFMIPFVVAIFMMATRELWMNIVKPCPQLQRLAERNAP